MVVQYVLVFVSSRRRHTRGALVTGVQTCALPILPLLFVRLWWRGRLAPAYRQRWGERLALGYATPPLTACVWLHAVSVGELLAEIGRASCRERVCQYV